MDTITVLVAGSGVMGRGIADSFAKAGLKTAVLSRNPEAVSGINEAVSILGRLPEEAPELIIETIPEVMELKLTLNAQIEEAYQGAAIIASNTSSLPLQKLADGLRYPEKFCGIHYFQPAHITPIVEVARVAQSHDATIERSLALLRQTGKQPITLSEPVDGLLINRLQQAIYHEAYSLIDRGICTAQDIDLAAKQLLGPRMSVTGMIEQKDLSGLDTHALSQRELIPTLHLSKEPSPVVQKKYADGNIGAESGQGFFDWRDMDVPAYRQDTGALLTAVLALLDRERPAAPHRRTINRRTIEVVEDGFHQVVKLEPRFAEVLQRHGAPPSRQRKGGFETVLKIIVQQQVSLASAEAIWRRVRRGLGRVNPSAVLALDEDALKAFGLSRPKAVYARSLAEEVASGRLNFRTLRGMADEQAIETLTRIKGIGRWTAEVYLLSVMQRPDIWPAADVALMEGARDILGLPARPSVKEMPALAEPWRPYRTFAARVIWLHYRHMTKRGTIG